MELYGKGYVIEYCVAFFRKKNERRLYESYVADALKAIADNTAKAVHEGIGLNKRYAEVLQEFEDEQRTISEPQTKETRTADQIVNHIKDTIKNLGG